MSGGFIAIFTHLREHVRDCLKMEPEDTEGGRVELGIL